MILPCLFNCSNDMALAANVRQYLPPRRIQQMEDDLAALAQQWEGTMFAGPWGWSLATKRRYEKMGVLSSELPSDDWLAEVRRLSSREFACGYIHDLLQTFNDERLLGHEMRYADALSPDLFIVKEEAQSLHSSVTASTPPQPLIFKSLWSSSGRGIFVSPSFDEPTKTRLQGYLNTQGGFLVDKFYEDKVLDFAMEFFIHPDHTVEFLGYSVFHAAANGTYGYNLVASQDELLQHIDTDAALLQQLIHYHQVHLSRIAYHGAVGIDMLKCRDGHIHPCVEINLRMNMGILALLLHQRYGSSCTMPLTPPRSHGFQALIDEGRLMIVYKCNDV